jgi:CRISPR system Cascade subunit CasA
MAWNALEQPWIPFRRRSGRVEWGSPSLIADATGDDPVVGLAAPRPDFNGALLEFLIGLLTVAVRPDDEAEWRERFHQPPSPDELQTRFAALPDAFTLDGNGPRFFQDLDAAAFAKSKVIPIARLLIDAPGEQTIDQNKDLFSKRGRVERLGRPAAAMALLTMQTYAPSGGQGHRTSLRGGGPLTTIILPGDGSEASGDQTLWCNLWANVLPNEFWENQPGHENVAAPSIFPWMARTRTSEKSSGTATRPGEMHPFQMFFALPRRIRLEFGEPGCCDVTGMEDEQPVIGFRMLNYGVQYVAWRHVLSPYYRDTRGEWLPVHGQPGGIAWRDWLGLTMRQPDTETREPARTVAHFLHRRAAQLRQSRVRLYAFGYDMDNMKARGWTESLRPAFAIRSDGQEAELVFVAKRLTEATSIAASALLKAVEDALFERSDDVSGDLSQIKSELWDRTEAAFFGVMEQIAVHPSIPAEVDALCADFVAGLETFATMIFDRWCPMPGQPPHTLRQIVGARYNLVLTLRGRSKLGQKLFTVAGLPVAVPPSPRGRKSKARQEPTS